MGAEVGVQVSERGQREEAEEQVKEMEKYEESIMKKKEDGKETGVGVRGRDCNTLQYIQYTLCQTSSCELVM